MKRLEQFRLARQEKFDNLFGASPLFIAGFLIAAAFLINPSIFFKVFQIMLLWLLMWASGRKNNILITIIIFLFVAVFNLFAPYGEILLSTRFFDITAGALMTGIHRAVTLTGLIFLSKTFIRRDIMLPGRLGALIGESFMILARITEEKKRITFKNFIADIDNLLLELSTEDASIATEKKSAPKKNKPIGVLIIITVIMINAALCFLGFILC